MTGPRVALLGFSIECNRFAPPATTQDFIDRTWFEGRWLVDEARLPAPRMLGELPGFVAAMDAAGPWRPEPGLLAMAEPNGPVVESDFQRMMDRWQSYLEAAGPLDGVYVVLHGAGLTTEDSDPEGTLLAMVRGVVGPAVPVVASFDLHANVSDRMVAAVDGFVGYRTNPHLDMRDRGAESAALLRRLIGGGAAHVRHVRLPIVPPTVTMLTAPDAPQRPYGALIDLGQRRMREAPYAGRVLNVSVMGGFAFADTPFNGLTAVVTATDPAAASDLAQEIAQAGWAMRDRFHVSLTSLHDAVALARQAENPQQEARQQEDRQRPALAFADVADNPGGGGRGNTLHILRAFHDGGVQGAVLGLLHDPALAAEAHALGQGATFAAQFNRGTDSGWQVQARVLALHDGQVQGRRGIFAGNAMDLGPCALLAVGALRVALCTRRVQCADPAFLEMLGIDLRAVRSLVVKSRGHFRGGFDEYFAHDQVIEVDAPGLTSPVLSRFAWRHLPRPVVPLDADATWP